MIRLYVITAAMFLIPSMSIASAEIKITAIPNQYVVAMKKRPGVRFNTTLNRMAVIEKKDLTPASTTKKFYKLTLSPVIESGDAIMRSITTDSDVLWVAPNYLYEGDLQDVVGFEGVTADPQIADQYHHNIMQNISAWEIEAGKKDIVVAVTDDGISYDHEDLASSLYVNANEIPGNGIDDDKNGYVDDVNGWNANGNNNDISTKGEHGTHVAGIVAAAADNDKGVAGTANGVKVMPIKIYDEGWDSATVAAAFTYAADSGARIITTSYNVDGMSSDQAYREAVKYAYSKGVLLFNSAGNSNVDNPTRTIVSELVLVCSTVADQKANDVKSNFSNYGYKIHLCAPGGGGEPKVGILSTLPNNQYGRMSGTSMSSPNAAAAAALIWSLHPEWTRAQVLSQLMGTTDVIDDLNPNYLLKLGSGRINSYKALTLAPRPLTIMRVAEVVDGVVMSGTNTFTVQINGVLDVAAASNLDNWKLVSAGQDELIDTGDDEVQLLSLSSDVKDTSREVLLNTKEVKKGKFKLIAKSSITDPFGTALDGNADGTPGDDFVLNFKVE